VTERKRLRSDRTDGRLLSTASFVHHRLKTLQPRLAFSPSVAREQFVAWRRKVRRKLRQLMTFPKLEAQPEPRMISTEPRDGYTLQRWELYPEPHSVLPVLMLVPDVASAASPAPAVICLPGSEQPKEALAGEPWPGPWKNRFGEHNFMARHVAEAGLVALAMDNPGTAELADPLHTDWRRQSGELIWLGRSYEGLSAFHKMAALRWMRTLPFVNSKRIALCGHSLGAKPALIVGVLDPAVRAVVWNDFAADWRAREVVTNLRPVAPWHYVPGFIRWFDYTDLMAALAPTPLLVTEGGRSEDHRRIRKAYALMGARGNFKVTFMPNFATSARRPLDRRKVPEGLTTEQYARYANFNGAHYFKDAVAVPWLRKMLAG